MKEEWQKWEEVEYLVISEWNSDSIYKQINLNKLDFGCSLDSGYRMDNDQLSGC